MRLLEHPRLWEGELPGEPNLGAGCEVLGADRVNFGSAVASPPNDLPKIWLGSSEPFHFPVPYDKKFAD